MRWENSRSLRFANYIKYDKRINNRKGLVPAVRVVLSEAVLVLREAVLVLREAVLVLEPTAIVIATMNDRSWLIKVSGFRVRVPLH